MNKQIRSIADPWEITQDIPHPHKVVKLRQENLFPWDNPKDYVKYVNKYYPQAMRPLDDGYKMFGHYTSAEIINGEVWVTFTPEKLAGKFWVHYA